MDLATNITKQFFQKIDNKNYVSIYNKNNNRVCSTQSNGSTKTYIIWTSNKKIDFNNNLTCNSASTDEDEILQLWHRRLGHDNIQSLRNILTKIRTNDRCEICAKI